MISKEKSVPGCCVFLIMVDPLYSLVFWFLKVQITPGCKMILPFALMITYYPEVVKKGFFVCMHKLIALYK